MRIAALVAAFLVAAPAAQAASACLIEPKSCSDLLLPKHAKLLRTLQKPASQRAGNETMAVALMYSTFETLQDAANRGCRRKDRVDLADFKPLFVLGDRAQKRAMMFKGTSQCAWMKVK
ncbi:hypothetical protein [Pseudaestuariivita atlantica]|uniref:Uncharacterized protein n=1 Tax=Pseudaestuariivita atlantica TaxID=1317121 RepID=A0A0L1JL63_9RHOB|nr:hypothetical protein [Pseudaestuariivita atlantica]KNG92489.1 hypothetical protein ATO11_17965 [Pseudaestuariivita atlantica]